MFRLLRNRSLEDKLPETKAKNFKRYSLPCFPRLRLGIVGLVERGAEYGQLQVNGRELVCLTDTQAAVSFVGREQCEEARACTLAVETVGENSLQILGVSDCVVETGAKEMRYPFIVTSNIRRTSSEK
uniref:Uncharacterized protein n=1 Tax=Trichobilharzia regenti TaxID=157069 RepID=A0AA85JD00_TRIRE|nr:unnamed protein product [Trichobilharzia regenti]